MNEDLPIAYDTATPIGWELVNFEDICGSGQYGWTSSASSEGTVKYLRTTDITKGKISWDSVPYCKETPVDLEKYLIQKNDILISRAGSVGFSAVIDETPYPIIFASYLIRFSPSKQVEADYIAHFLKSPIYWKQIADVSSGIALANINAKKISKIQVLLPPLNEQRRIVEKLDRIMERLRRAHQELSHIKKLIDRYRQAVLTAAFRGDLTADWRVKELSESWYFDNVGNISTKIHYGYTASSTSVDTGTKLLRITDIQNGTVNWETVPFCEITQTDELKYKLEMGDLLFARTGATVGKSFLIETEIPKAVFASYLIRIILANNVIRKYVYYFFQSDLYWAQIKDNQIGTGQPNVSGKILSKLMIPVCPLEEQKEIVRRIEERFSKIDKLEQEYQKAMKLCDRLEQATLAKAFRGELVPQDPNDEPASVLLERIRSERQEKPKGKAAKSSKKLSHDHFNQTPAQ